MRPRNPVRNHKSGSADAATADAAIADAAMLTAAAASEAAQRAAAAAPLDGPPVIDPVAIMHKVLEEHRAQAEVQRPPRVQRQGHFWPARYYRFKDPGGASGAAAAVVLVFTTALLLAAAAAVWCGSDCSPREGAQEHSSHAMLVGFLCSFGSSGESRDKCAEKRAADCPGEDERYMCWCDGQPSLERKKGW